MAQRKLGQYTGDFACKQATLAQQQAQAGAPQERDADPFLYRPLALLLMIGFAISLGFGLGVMAVRHCWLWATCS